MLSSIRFQLFAFLLLGLANTLSAQTEHRILCGQEWMGNYLHTHYPDYAEAVDHTFSTCRQPGTDLRDELVIPVVVHVVWNAPEENLSQELIEAQIATLNADFNRENADTANLRPIFQSVAGDAQIRFELVTIERVQTTATFDLDVLGGSLLPEVKSTALGGSDAWDPEHYLNLWICKIQPIAIGPIVLGQILGFAFPPADLDNWPPGSSAPDPGEDGVVIDFRAIGPNNPNPIEIPGGVGNLIVEGRTATHEVGHYLGLRHIWGDGGTFGPNDCAQSDGVDDTPFADSQSNFDCDTTRNTCTQVEAYFGADVPDLIENFMDYASEDCMNMFTAGQVNIMRNVLTGPRSGLLETTSIAHPEPEADVAQLIPNPAASSTTLVLAKPLDTARQLHVLDAYGRVVFTMPVQAGQQQILMPVTNLPNGIYALRLSGSGLREWLVVQH